MISKEFLASRASVIPGKLPVRVYPYIGKDAFGNPFDTVAERIEESRSETRSIEAGTDGTTIQFRFTSTDLGERELPEGSVIQCEEEYWAINAITPKLMRSRFECTCDKSVSPIEPA